MGFEFTSGQLDVIREAKECITKQKKQVFQYAGNPGTGKSVVLAEIINQLHLRPDEILPMAYTGTAANVMRRKGLINACTMYSGLYEAVEAPLVRNGEVVMDTYLDKPVVTIKFVPKAIDPKIKLLVFDEAGMIPFHLKHEIERRGLPIIATGDLDQLPPIDDTPAYLADGDVMVLTEIMRQAWDSPIIYLSQQAKIGAPIHNGLYYGNNQRVYVMEREEVPDYAYANSQVVLCCKNKTRDYLNSEIRVLKGCSGRLPRHGEKVVCRKNNSGIVADNIMLSNGTIGYVMNSPDVSGLSRDKRTFTIDLMPFMSSAPFFGINADFQYFNADYETKRLIKNDKYSVGEKFELAYAITVHLSQGSQYEEGIYYEEFLNRDIQARLNYTAITRFANKMIYVKQPIRKYF